MFNWFNHYRKTKSGENSLVDEKENKALVFILLLVAIGILGIAIYVYQDIISATKNEKTSYFNSMLATLFFLAGAVFSIANMLGFFFGIPRTTVLDESEKSKSQYIGNDNLLQVSDWVTKIILGLGLTQIYQIPGFLNKTAQFIVTNTHVNNKPLIILIMLYFASLGFLFGYLWTRLYFIKMLHASDTDINNKGKEAEKETDEEETNTDTKEDKKPTDNHLKIIPR